MNINFVDGDLIKLAKEGKFDVITHGCNCYSNMGAGIAPQMAKHFGADQFPMELENTGILKLGNIDWKEVKLSNGNILNNWVLDSDISKLKSLFIINSYTQDYPGKSNKKSGVPLDYDALILCFRKINIYFKKLHIGLPWIGCGLAGGDKSSVEYIIKEELTNMKVTIVEYKP